MSIHAQPVSTRVFIAVASLILAYFLLAGDGNFGTLIVSILFGLAAMSVSYIIVYVGEQYFANLHEPLPAIEGPVRAEPTTETVERPIPCFRKLRKAVLQDDLQVISKRALEDYGVCGRLEPEADVIINYLVENKMVYPIGNSQYKVNANIIDFLTEGQND